MQAGRRLNSLLAIGIFLKNILRKKRKIWNTCLNVLLPNFIHSIDRILQFNPIILTIFAQLGILVASTKGYCNSNCAISKKQGRKQFFKVKTI